MAGRTITAAEIRDVVIKSAIAAQHKVELAVVRSFTAATATAGPLAEVELSTKFRRMVDYVSETYNGPVLGNVPVLYSRLTFPLIAGDEVLVVCADRGVDTAYENGGTNNEPEQQPDGRLLHPLRVEQGDLGSPDAHGDDGGP